MNRPFDVNTRPWLPYVVPMALYMAFLFGQTNANLLWLYPLKTVAVAATLWWFRKEYVELGGCSGASAKRPDPAPALRGSAATIAVVVGLFVIALWIGLDPYYPKLSELLNSFEWTLSRWMNSPPPTSPVTSPFDPTTIEPATFRYAFIGFRVIGGVLVVPVMEELFWRAFLIRWLVNEDFQRVPVGTFTWMSFVITTLFFGLEHDQWLVGLICGGAYNGLLYRTRSVWACVVAHAASNAALAGWVLARGDWRFW